MSIQKTAITLVRAAEIFIDFFERVTDMTNTEDVNEVLAIARAVCYAMQSLQSRNE